MMYRALTPLLKNTWTLRNHLLSRKLHSDFLHVQPEVRTALKNGVPVVALESTIITHGMPYPSNLDTAMNVERMIRSQGAVPATIAILNGQIHVGLQEDQLRYLAEKKHKCVKTSRRDLAYVVSQKLNGGTTVSGTMLVAHKAGIPVFVTGGIGGVHRGAERTMDVSADLTELGRTPVAVISSGAKSILDIGKTLEYLETQGVCVATLGPSDVFPAFFSATSAFKSPAHVSTVDEAASLLDAHFRLQTQSGVLLAVPMPPGHENLAARIEDIIASAVQEAEEKKIDGRDVTPFLLARVNELTKGESLKANMVLIENNAKAGGQVAVSLANLRHKNSFVPHIPSTSSQTSQTGAHGEAKNPTFNPVVVIGGATVDFVATVNEDSIKMDASTHRGTIRKSYGGVGRNLADALTRLGTESLLLTSIGEDNLGQDLMEHNPLMSTRGFYRVPSKTTATYMAVLDKEGQTQFGIGDFDVFNDLNLEWAKKHEKEIRSAPLLVLDANTPQATMDYVLDMCAESGTPVWFEPTDHRKAAKPFASNRWKTIKYSSPNLAELQAMASFLQNGNISCTPPSAWPELKEWVVEISSPLLEHMQCLLVTIGKAGMMILNNDGNSHSLLHNTSSPNTRLSYSHYPPPAVKDEDVVSVSGAGDCLAAGFIAGMLRGLPENVCVEMALEMTAKSLLASPAVPSTITEELVTKYVTQKCGSS